MSDRVLETSIEEESDRFIGEVFYKVHYSFETFYPDSSPNGGRDFPVIDKVMMGGKVVKVDDDTEEILLDKVYDFEGMENF